MMGELDGATQAYERAMSFNQWSVPAMMAISSILRAKDQFPAAVEYLRLIMKVEPANGEVWSSMGIHLHRCYAKECSAKCGFRALLPYDGRLAASVLRIPAGPVPPA